MDMTRGAASAMRRRRWLPLLAVAAAVGLPACHNGPHLDLTVSSTIDGHDADPGDGICEMTAGAGDCSLRAAVDEVNATPDVRAAITLPSATYALTLPGADNTNAGGDLDLLGGSVTIQAAMPGAAIVASGSDRGVDLMAGSLGLHRVAVRNATTGGIVVRAGATLSASQISVHSNGGAGVTVLPGGVARLLHSTIADNGTAGTIVQGSLEGAWLTIAANGTNGISRTSTATVTLGESVVANNDLTACNLPITSDGYNLVTDETCGLSGVGDISGVGGGLGPLTADTLASHPPLTTSPAYDSISLASGRCGGGGTDFDQRGGIRPFGAGCDRGAIEVTPPAPLALTVDNVTDVHDAIPGDGVCDIDAAPADLGDCTLRAAIDETNATTVPAAIALGPDAITISEGIDPMLSLAGAAEDLNATGDLDITDDLVLHGNGATVDANDLDRVLHVRSGESLIEDLTITDGTARSGGGLRVDTGATADIVRTTVTGNEANGDIIVCTYVINPSQQTCSFDNEGGGGGIRSLGTLSIADSTIAANVAEATGCVVVQLPSGASYTSCGSTEGGGVRAGLTASIENSTVSGNVVANGSGGGLSGSLTARNVTLADNTTPAIYGPISVSGSTVTGPAPACASMEPWIPRLPSGGHNLFPDASCLPNATDLVGLDPLLGPLADNGGPTLTHLPAVGSPAIDSVPLGTAGLCDGALPTDQRGVARPQGAACDRGAVEQ